NLEVIRRAFPALLHLADSAEVAVAAARAGDRRAPPDRRRNWALNLSYALSMRGHVSEAWAIAVDNMLYLAGEIAGLGLVPTDSALKIMRPWMDRRDDASLAPVPVLALARDTASLLRMSSKIDSAMPKVTIPFQRAMIAYFGATVRAYTAL